MNATLLIIYNNKFDQNIPILEKIYQDKFINIFHLVPFYCGNQKNVIPIYQVNDYFQGYVAQSYKTIFSQEVDHYIYISDDLLLNPKINQHNYQKFFNLDSETSYISSLTPLHRKPNVESELFYDERGFWSHKHKAVNWRPEQDILKELPNIEEAIALFNKFQLTVEPLREMAANEKGAFNFSRFLSNKNALTYPLICSYSDFFIIPKKIIRKFSHLCGVFAVSNLWVEVAIPTALVLSSDKISTLKDSTFSNKGALWTSQQKKFLEVFDNNLVSLIDQFPDSYPYIHPIKLSTWTYSK
jgi:hypothetical protein